MFWAHTSTSSLLIYQDENEDKDENPSLCLFLYVLKQTCDEPTNNCMYCKDKLEDMDVSLTFCHFP